MAKTSSKKLVIGKSLFTSREADWSYGGPSPSLKVKIYVYDFTEVSGYQLHTSFISPSPFLLSGWFVLNLVLLVSSLIDTLTKMLPGGVLATG